MIIAAAIKHPDGTVYSVPKPGRHHDVIRHMIHDCGLPKSAVGEQGFLLDAGEFVNREQGAAHALATGQVEQLNWGPDLFSEDLW